MKNVKKNTNEIKTMLFEPVWKEKQVRISEFIPKYSNYIIFAIGMEEIKQDLGSCDNMPTYYYIDIKDLEESFEEYASKIFEKLKDILANKSNGKVLFQVITKSNLEGYVIRGILGLLKTAEMRDNNFNGQLIELEDNLNSQEIIEIINENAKNTIDKNIRYYNKKRYVSSWREIEECNSMFPWKNNGSYIITGGTDKAGLIFVNEILKRVKCPNIIITGKSQVDLNTLLKVSLNEAKVLYKQIDITNEAEVSGLIDFVNNKFGKINGIINNESIVPDNLMIKKDFKEILSTKVKGIINLDQASKDLNLDFFVAFSSIATEFGDIEQACYSTANAFIDSFAIYRNELVKLKKRQGKTVSISWQICNDDKQEEKIITKLGSNKVEIESISKEESINALEKALYLNKSNVMVLKGNSKTIRSNLISDSKTFLDSELAELNYKNSKLNDLSKIDSTLEEVKEMDIKYNWVDDIETSKNANSNDLLDKIQNIIIDKVCEIVKSDADYIEASDEFSEYGFDSVTFTVLANSLNEEFKIDIEPTIFFEYTSINEFAEYLADEYYNAFSDEIREDNITETKEINTKFSEGKNSDSVSLSKNSEGRNVSHLIEKIEDILRDEISEVLKVDNDYVELEDEFSEYGFDSVTFTLIANNLNKEYTIDIEPTIFFEYTTIKEMAQYLANEYEDVFFEGSIEDQVSVDDDVIKKNDFRESEEFNSRRVEEENKECKERVTLNQNNELEPIAIIGMSGRFPEARDIKEYWRNLTEGKNCIKEIPNERWDWKEIYGDPKKEANKTNIKWGGFIEGIDEFDPLFFGISPREAELMDPQHRLMMIYIWKAIEDAGYSAESLSGSNTAIFVGGASSGYNELLAKANVKIEGYSPTGSLPSVGPNRMSYYLNFHGPSEPIETACSSSLVAIHKAVSVIRDGSCNLAIAGGINTIVTPYNHIGFSKAGMLCEDGRCKTFSDKANGYVRGEGVGIILLKKLEDAEKDGDNIYGIIRGTSENHGGHTNSLTAPNPKAQAQLIFDAYNKSGINPGNVTYIEAHGTGTELGDPIEINGLKSGFKELYKKQGIEQVRKNYCGLASVKSNIGHLEMASGIAGVIKVLLQMKYKTLVKTLNCENINPYIKLKDSPFYIVQRNKEWERLRDKEGNEIPRIAGVSSFGFGGVNAHVVIQEYNSKKENKAFKQEPVIILLSAKTKDRLKVYANELLKFINEEKVNNSDLCNIAYTLQVGRNSMEERLAMIVNSLDELKSKLTQFLDDKDDIENLFFGQVKRNNETLSILRDDDEIYELIDKWIDKKKYKKVLTLWIEGIKVNWERLYKEKPHRISLPTYPFYENHYWVPESNIKEEIEISNKRSFINPLVHENTSNFKEQKFSSVFEGKEFFLKDHVVDGKKMLPGVAYLEMARCAFDYSLGNFDNTKNGIKIKDVIWQKPIIAENKSTKVNISLIPNNSSSAYYNVYTDFTKQNKKIICGKGIVELFNNEDKFIDIKKLRNDCNNAILSKEQCYNMFNKMGITYGNGHQGIDKLYLGDNQIIARLSLPSSVLDTLDKFVLHPGLIDSALQAAIGLLIKGDKMPSDLYVPYTLKEIYVYGRCISNMWVSATHSLDNKFDDSEQKFDINICNDDGQIIVQIKSLAMRRLNNIYNHNEKSSKLNVLLAEPKWIAKAAENTHEFKGKNHVILLCEQNQSIKEQIEKENKDAHCINLQSDLETIEERYNLYAEEIIKYVQKIIKNGDNNDVLIQLLINSNEKQRSYEGLYGILKTTQLECSKIKAQMIMVNDNSKISEVIKLERYNIEDKSIWYKDDVRLVSQWIENINDIKGAKSCWKDNGVYLITGGVGGLGLLFAKEIAKRVKNSTAILVGRSNLSSDKKEKLKEIESLGVNIQYKQVDISEKNQVVDLITDIKNEFGKLNGIIHAAGVLRDGYIVNKKIEDLRAVFKPKVNGIINLDYASNSIDLDFFVAFSSISGAFGNEGQACYSSANAFMDAYAHYKNSLSGSNNGKNKILVINWPLWKDGGMNVNKDIEKRFFDKIGMAPMNTKTGIRAFYYVVESSKEQTVVIEGNIDKLRNFYNIKSNNKQDKLQVINKKKEYSKDLLIAKAQEVIIDVLANALKIPANQIKNDVPFDRYGIDSILQMDLIHSLEEVIGELPKTLLFEYNTVIELSDYIIKNHIKSLEELLEVSDDKNIEEDLTENEFLTNDTFDIAEEQRFINTESKKNEEIEKIYEKSADIAIIGISGRYPGADTLEELWNNLKSGKNCVTEVSEDRWKTSIRSLKNKSRDNYYGGFLNNINTFDNDVFDIDEEKVMDMTPEQRIFLEVAFETFEDGGYTRRSLQDIEGGVGVFIGSMYNQYNLSNPSLEKALINSNSTEWEIANRVSNYFDITGPSVTINSACSSSLTAIHIACESIKQNDCSMAIAGGINLTLDPSKYDALENLKFLGSGNKSNSFGKGDGYIPGEGAGAVLLKPISSAIRDNDKIYGVIKGSYINHSGGRQAYTVPDPKQQTNLIINSIKRSGIDPKTINYVESAANGSPLGDPIEVIALNKAFSKYTDDKQYCSLGSVKSNLGHLEAASGISQLTKVILQLKYKTLVPTINTNPKNPNINLENTPFYLQNEVAEWKPCKDSETSEDLPRRSMINSFGAGGSYSNIIIEEFIDESNDKETLKNIEQEEIFIFSSKSEWSLIQYLNKFEKLIEEKAPINLAGLAKQLLKINHDFEYRVAIIASSTKELLEKVKNVQIDLHNIKDENIITIFNKNDINLEGIDLNRFSNIKQAAINWSSGEKVDFEEFYREVPSIDIDLPKYAFDHRKVFEFVDNDEDLKEEIEDIVFRNIFEKISEEDLSEEEFLEYFSEKEGVVVHE